MKQSFFYLLQLVLFTSISFAQIPAGYYDSANGLSGSALQVELSNIIDGHTSVSYTQLWTSFQTTDDKANGKVWDMYSDIPSGTPAYEFTFITNQCGTYSTEGDCYNREHSFPKSWFGDVLPMNTDLFHLYPTDGKVNGQRNNYPYGEVSSPTWTSTNGSKLGPCSFAGYSGTVFEPIDDYKGDFARSYFYMATRYYYLIDGWYAANGNPPMLDGSGFSSWAEALLISWHNADPVSQKEIDRNNTVYGIQNNRNPFIDHPEYVAAIYGGADTYPPVFTSTYPAAASITTTTLNIVVNMNESGTAYYVVLPDGSSAPSVAQVKAGKNASGVAISSPLSGSISIAAASTDYSASITGLTASTNYDVYVVAQDAQSTPNVQTSTTLVNVTTTSSNPVPSAYMDDLIITEYVEGSSNNKYLEIWNNTGVTKALSNYSIQIFYNGATTATTTITLIGTLTHGSVYVIENSSESLSVAANLPSSSLTFNGNDAVVLVGPAKGNVDVIGIIGSATVFAENITMRRNADVTNPTTTYNASEWTSYATDVVSGLGNSGPLPIDLVNFTATSTENGILVSWQTASETNNHFFTVERSLDTKFFFEESIISGAGNSNSTNRYQYIDNNTNTNQTVYYRLKQTDYDGAYTYSDIITVNTRVLALVLNKTYCVDGNLFFSINSNVNRNASVEMIDLSGRSIFSQHINIESGFNNYRIAIPKFATGIYFMKISTSNNTVIQDKVILN